MMRRAAVLSLALWGASVFAEPLEFTGYWKSFLSATDVEDSYRRLGLWDDDYLFDDVERVRLKVQYSPSDKIAVGAHYEAVLHWGDTVKLRRELAEDANLPARPRFMDLEDEIIAEAWTVSGCGWSRTIAFS